MCLPVKMLKVFVQFESWIIILIGIGALIGTIVLDANEDQYLSFITEFMDKSIINGLIIALYTLSGLILFFGLCGVIGSCYRIGTLLFCFNVGNFCLTAIFLALAVVGFYFGSNSALMSHFSQEKCEDEATWPTSYYLNEAELGAQKYFCQDTTYDGYQGGCECYYNLTITNETSPYLTYYSSSNSSLPTNIQSCPDFNQYFDEDEIQYVDYLGNVESYFSCSGWCTSYPLYVFSDVNSGTPTNGCYDAIIDTIEKCGNITGGVAIAVFVLLVLCITCVCCLCFHPETKQKGNFLARMTITEPINETSKQEDSQI